MNDKNKTQNLINIFKVVILFGAILMWFWGNSYGDDSKPDRYFIGLGVFLAFAFSILNYSFYTRHKNRFYSIAGFLLIFINTPVLIFVYLDYIVMNLNFWIIIGFIDSIIILSSMMLTKKRIQKEDEQDEQDK